MLDIEWVPAVKAAVGVLLSRPQVGAVSMGPCSQGGSRRTAVKAAGYVALLGDIEFPVGGYWEFSDSCSVR